MSIPIRPILILTLMLSLAGQLPAQETATTTSTERTSTAIDHATAEPGPGETAQNETAATSTEGGQTTDTTGTAATAKRRADNSYEIRNIFTNLLRNSPSELATILVLDPTLLSNDAFLAGYPDLAAFVAKYPEVRRNPRFYLAEFRLPGDASRVVDEIFEALSIASVFVLITFALFWLVRTIIEQRRWSRLSRVQTEVHNKILDRFGTSSEVLEYIRTPAGSKFLEAAPIPLHAAKPSQGAPLTRIVWSIQLGVVLAVAAIGMLLVSSRLSEEASHGFFALGVIGFCAGLGFVASAFVSLFVSRRLGLWEPQPPTASGAERFDEHGIVK
ncbi:MAG TPA: hypothetical protein VGF69_24155 [Thermoanaerobaculia bacterium]|jgi:hypothetical protein